MRTLMIGTLVVLLVSQAATAEDAIPPAAKVIRAEALRSNQDPGGRPLPMVAHWHRNTCPLSWQIKMIRKGHYVLPWIDYNRGMSSERIEKAYAEGIKQLAAWKLPLVLITGGQWEQDFYNSDEYKGLPADQTGCAVSLKGKKIKCVSPFSPVKPWASLGRKWTDNPACRKLQELYPNPPLVLFVSNNEAHDLRWHKAEKSKRYMDKHGAGKSDEFKRKVFADGWIERYSALIKGMRDGLAEDGWRKASRFIAYNAMGPDHLGRWEEWKKYSLATDDRVSPDWYMWEGGIPESYDNHWEPAKTAFRVWSMQVEMMNLVPMRRDAFAVKPNYWFEVIFWDGNLPTKGNDKYKTYKKLGVEYTPAVYAGWVQYNMWTLTPRVAREWRGSTDPRDRWWPHFEQIVKAVDRVHGDGVLSRFWRKGQLVPNRAHPHPFSVDLPKCYKDVDRWFALDTSLDPKRPWDLTTEIEVFALTRVVGKKPQREWLVYAHAPKGDRKGVEITIPEYGKVTVDVPVAGAFHHVQEQGAKVMRVGRK